MLTLYIHWRICFIECEQVFHLFAPFSKLLFKTYLLLHQLYNVRNPVRHSLFLFVPNCKQIFLFFSTLLSLAFVLREGKSVLVGIVNDSFVEFVIEEGLVSDLFLEKTAR